MAITSSSHCRDSFVMEEYNAPTHLLTAPVTPPKTTAATDSPQSIANRVRFVVTAMTRMVSTGRTLKIPYESI